MEKFFLNHQFFDFFLDCYYPVLDNIYIHIIKKDVVKKPHQFLNYHCEFCVHVPIFNVDTSLDSFHRVFSFDVHVTPRKILLINLNYLLESDLVKSSLRYFPITPCWLLPCTRYEIFLHRCRLALAVYKEKGFI